jgi:hypothetical protein
LLITSNDTSVFAIETNISAGVSVQPARSMRLPGTILRSKMVDNTSPIAYGYDDNLAIFGQSAPIFNVSNFTGGGRGRRGGGGERVTGRGTGDDPDVVQNRPPDEIPDTPRVNTWEAGPVTDEQLRNGINVIPPQYRPRVILRWADNNSLFISGLLDGGNEIAQHAAVIDVPVERGHVILFSNNPFWRAETQGSYFLVFNAILNFDNLNAGRKLAEK